MFMTQQGYRRSRFSDWSLALKSILGFWLFYALTVAVRAILGTDVPRAEHMLLLLVGSSLLIKNYDLAIFGLATPQIQASLGIPEESLGLYVSLVRLGVLASFPLAYFADQVGRRRLFLVTVAGMTVATLLTAFSQTPWQYAATTCPDSKN